MSTEITAAQKTALLKLPGFKDIQKQYAKESKMEGGRKKRMRGRGFWDDVGNWFVQAGKDINQFLKDSKLVSNVAAYALPILGAMGGALLTVNPLGATAGGIAGKSAADYIKSQGYGANKMKGMGTFPLAINPPPQRMRGTNPKSKMHGKGLLQDISNDPALRAIGNVALNTFLPAANVFIKPAISSALSAAKKLSGKGYATTNNTFGANGVPQKVTAPAHSGMVHNMGGRGKGKASKMRGYGGTEYGSISSEYGNVQF